MRPFVLALCLFAGPALGQEEWRPDWDVTVDLDGDEVGETYALRDNGQGSVDLTVTVLGEDEGVVPGIAWLGGMAGQEPELAVSHGGSLLVTSMNESIGRDRWRITLTVAHRDGDLRVAGITYTWTDTLNPEKGWGVCDLNLLSGRGEVRTEGAPRAVELSQPAPLLWEWRDMEPPVPIMELCRGEG